MNIPLECFSGQNTNSVLNLVPALESTHLEYKMCIVQQLYEISNKGTAPF